jgi:hypothetical protein
MGRKEKQVPKEMGHLKTLIAFCNDDIRHRPGNFREHLPYVLYAGYVLGCLLGTLLSHVFVLDERFQLRTILRKKKHYMLAFPRAICN